MPSPLAILAPLVGHCFVGTMAPGVVDRHCFTSVYEGAHVRDVHVVSAKGKPVYSGETIYSANVDTVEFTYLNSLGGVGHGTAKAEGGALRFTGSMPPSPDKAGVPFDTRWTLGPNGYSVTDAGSKPIVFTREP